MVVETVNEQNILEELHQVSQDRWDDVLSFIRSLRLASPAPANHKRPMNATDLLNSGLIGLWADRADFGDSQEFARRLRQQAQTRRHD